MDEMGVDILKTEETEESGIKYFNINVSREEVERDPDIVRLCSDIGILEYVKKGNEGGKDGWKDFIREMKGAKMDGKIL